MCLGKNYLFLFSDLPSSNETVLLLVNMMWASKASSLAFGFFLVYLSSFTKSLTDSVGLFLRARRDEGKFIKKWGKR